MKKLFFLFTVIVICCISNSIFAAKPTIAVMPFQVSPFMRTITINNVLITRQVLEREFSNQLIEFLVKSRKFNVLNRTDIQRIIAENRLTDSVWAKPGQEQMVGKLLVSDYLVTGTINRLEFLRRRQNIAITNEVSTRVTGTFKFQFKITAIKSGKVVCAEQIIEKLKSDEVRRLIPASERRDWTLSDFKDFLFKRSANKAGNQILSGIYPIKIASVKGSSVMLNRGRGAGIAAGQIYTVFNQGEVVKDPDTGEVLGANEEEAGTIKISAANPKFSSGKIIKGKGKIATGAICRKQKVVKTTAAPAYPRATPGW
jgi:Curli production assembly/transport component CsgG